MRCSMKDLNSVYDRVARGVSRVRASRIPFLLQGFAALVSHNEDSRYQKTDVYVAFTTQRLSRWR